MFSIYKIPTYFEISIFTRFNVHVDIYSDTRDYS